VDPIFILCDLIRETSYDIHCYLKHGYLEKVYQNALKNRLTKLNLEVRTDISLSVYDKDGAILGEYIPDLFVENTILIELKACRTLAPEHTSQLLGYMRAGRIEHGLLINFGASKLEIKKFALSSDL
jgi:GxxExxY protein